METRSRKAALPRFGSSCASYNRHAPMDPAPSVATLSPMRMRLASRRVAMSPIVVLGAVMLMFHGFSDTFFVGFSPRATSASLRDRVVMHSKVTREKGYKRRAERYTWITSGTIVEDPIAGRQMVRNDWGERFGFDCVYANFNPAQATGTGVTVEFKRHPFGITMLKPGKNGKGAMVWKVAKPMFVNDPWAQAYEGGVKPGMVIKKVNGVDVSDKDFRDVVLSLDEPIFGAYYDEKNGARIKDLKESHKKDRLGCPKYKRPEGWKKSSAPRGGCTDPYVVEFAEVPGFKMP